MLLKTFLYLKSAVKLKYMKELGGNKHTSFCIRLRTSITFILKSCLEDFKIWSKQTTVTNSEPLVGYMPFVCLTLQINLRVIRTDKQKQNGFIGTQNLAFFYLVLV